MSELKHLKDFEGYRPLGEINTLAEYLGTHGQNPGGLIADSISEALRQKNGLAPYIGSLALQIEERLAENRENGLSLHPIDSTNLTELFKNYYGVEMGNLRKPLRLYGGLAYSAGEFFIKYQMKSKGPGCRAFWQLSGSGPDSYLNMSCVGGDASSPALQGSGNIALMPGVEEAITADINMLVQK